MLAGLESASCAAGAPAQIAASVICSPHAAPLPDLIPCICSPHRRGKQALSSIWLAPPSSAKVAGALANSDAAVNDSSTPLRVAPLASPSAAAEGAAEQRTAGLSALPKAVRQAARCC